MARPYRLQAEHCFYHITSRGDDRKKIFLNDRDYQKFLEYISLAKAKFHFHVYAYCLLTNHYHLLLETTQANISKVMHYINGSYTTYYNTKRKRSGHVFQGRFKSLVVDKDSYFLELSRYIHLNPVKAKIAEIPEAYLWSSYLGYMGKKDPLLVLDRIKQCLDMDMNQYRQFVLQGIDKPIDPFKSVYAGFLLGPAPFIKEKLKDLKDQAQSKEIAYRGDISEGVDIDSITHEVAYIYHKKAKELYASKKKPVFAKKVAICLAKRLTHLTNAEIGAKFGITYSAVSKAAGDVERLMKEDKDVNHKVVGIISHFKG
ncbi:MAG: transposase [Candidatus Omnitrophica bacterium]|nr:transposase [Candidatus Omnitrophota bacterium]